jgi:hypothetical protein
MGLILLIVLVVLLMGGLPRWGYSRSWGYGPSGGLGLLLAVVLVLVLVGYIPRGFWERWFSMKASVAGLLVFGACALAGCDKGTPGGPGISNPPQKQPVYGETDNTFNLSVPRMSTTLHQGETKEASIGIARGKNFDGDVELIFAEGPRGVSLDSAVPVIKHGDTEARVTLKATADASLGEFTIKVTGHPTTGADATSEFKVTVAKK